MYKIDYQGLVKKLSQSGCDVLMFLKKCKFDNVYIANARLMVRDTINQDVYKRLCVGLRYYDIDPDPYFEAVDNEYVIGKI